MDPYCDSLWPEALFTPPEPKDILRQQAQILYQMTNGVLLTRVVGLRNLDQPPMYGLYATRPDFGCLLIVATTKDFPATVYGHECKELGVVYGVNEMEKFLREYFASNGVVTMLRTMLDANR
jgi:hypothetical protein